MQQMLFAFFLLGLPFSLFTQNNTFLVKELAELESYLTAKDSIKETVSVVSVGWHIDHSLKVLSGIINSLEKADPKSFKPSINFLRGLVFTTNNMPRGAGKAGKSTLPPAIITTEEVLAQFKTIRQSLLTIHTLPRKAYFKHPVFGLLKKKKSKRFMVVHTTHHLKIIRDILAN